MQALPWLTAWAAVMLIYLCCRAIADRDYPGVLDRIFGGGETSQTVEIALYVGTAAVGVLLLWEQGRRLGAPAASSFDG